MRRLMQSFAKYRNLVEIGRGGMAVVYRATDPTGNLVALKVLAGHLAADDSARQRFLQESRLELIHPNIVHVLDRGVHDGVPYFAMEYVSGESLDRILLRRGRLSSLELLPILKDAARALDYAHRRGVIHRDVKPNNILVRDNGQALLADFGVAKASEQTGYTATRVRIGSAYYMSPEQALGVPEVTKAADIYALGVTAYFALTGRHPFEGESDVAVARMHIDQPPMPLTVFDPSIPEGVSQAVLWALAKVPAGRPSSASQFVYEYEKALEAAAAPIAAPQPAPAVRLSPTPAPGPGVAPIGAARDTPAARIRQVALAGIVSMVGLCCLLAGAWGISTSGQNRVPPATPSAIPATRSLAAPAVVEPAVEPAAGETPTGGTPSGGTPTPTAPVSPTPAQALPPPAVAPAVEAPTQTPTQAPTQTPSPPSPLPTATRLIVTQPPPAPPTSTPGLSPTLPPLPTPTATSTPRTPGPIDSPLRPPLESPIAPTAPSAGGALP